jgi:hypothetical protein
MSMDFVGGGSFAPGDALRQVGLIGLASPTGPRYVVRVDRKGLILSRTPGGPPIKDHRNRRLLRFPPEKFERLHFSASTAA